MIELTERKAGLRDKFAPYLGERNLRAGKNGSDNDGLDGLFNFPPSRKEFLRKLWRTNILHHLWDGGLLTRDLAQAGTELLQLWCDPLYYGEGAPEGDGQTDVIVPGFTAGSWTYRNSKICIERFNYRVVNCPVRFNFHVQPVEQTLEKFVDFVQRLSHKVKRRLTLTGHSLGGLKIYAASLEHPKEIEESADHLMFIGSPVPESVNSIVGGLYAASQYLQNGDDFKFLRRLIEKMAGCKELPVPKNIKVTSIDTSNNGVIRGHQIGRPEDQFEIEGASHGGLVLNPKALRIKLHRMAGVL